MKKDILEILIEAAKAGGKVLLSYYKTELKVETKSSKRELLTQADLESQRVIIETLTRLMVENGISENEIGFICEENFSKEGKHTFIVDPLDGTSSFVEQADTFTVSIGYYLDFEAKTAVIYIPVKDQLYLAEKGKGAYKIENGQKSKLLITERKLSDSLLCYNTSSNTEVAQQILRIITNLVPFVYRARENPSLTFNLMRLAENRYQIVFNARTKIWDIAAAKLIVEEAGGKVANWDGENFTYNFLDTKVIYPLIAGHPRLIPEVIKHLYE